jgi:hypothetical protein
MRQRQLLLLLMLNIGLIQRWHGTRSSLLGRIHHTTPFRFMHALDGMRLAVSDFSEGGGGSRGSPSVPGLGMDIQWLG